VTQRLNVEVEADRGVLVFTDPDGTEHVCRSPEEAWDLLEDLALQVQETARQRRPRRGSQTQAIAVAAKPEPEAAEESLRGGHRSRRAAVEARRKAAREAQAAASGSAALVRAEHNKVARHQEPHYPEVVDEQEPAPEEEHGAFERGFAKVAHALIKKGGDISKTSRFGRGGRFGRPKGT